MERFFLFYLEYWFCSDGSSDVFTQSLLFYLISESNFFNVFTINVIKGIKHFLGKHWVVLEF
jgi:hypothetical protein